MINRLLHIITVAFVLLSCEEADKELFINEEENPSGIVYTYNSNDFFKKDIVQENHFIKTGKEQKSSFSIINNETSVFSLYESVRNGEVPSFEYIGTHELINLFSYNYKDPEDGNKLALNYEITNCPWQNGHYLLRFGLKGKTIQKEFLPPANFIFLIDVSGSMSMNGKMDIVKTSFNYILDNLRPSDRISIITYAEEAGELYSGQVNNNRGIVNTIINELTPVGITAGAKGIKRAFEIAFNNYIEGGNNRIFIATDGDFNVGPSTRYEMADISMHKEKNDVFLTILGIGDKNMNEGLLKNIAQIENGNYIKIDSRKQAEKVLNNNYSKLYPVAKNVRTEVEFNNSVIESFRLVGYENSRLLLTDFDGFYNQNAEVGAGQTITVLYELVPKNNQDEILGSIKIKYKDTQNGKTQVLVSDIKNEHFTFDSASENMKFAASMAAFSLKSRNSLFQGNMSYSTIVEIMSKSVDYDPYGYKNDFLQVIKNFAYE